MKKPYGFREIGMKYPKWTAWSVALLVLIMLLHEQREHSLGSGHSKELRFEQQTIDADGPHAVWGKTYGDINGDGLFDLLVAGRSPKPLTLYKRLLRKLGVGGTEPRGGDLLWYQSPDWTPHLISNELHVRTDMEVGDVDNDGLNDVVVLTDAGVYWLKNPAWEKHLILAGQYHDVELADLDRDGDIDIVLRDQGLFGHQSGHKVQLLLQDRALQWRAFSLDVPQGEGLMVSDMNNDQFPDVVVNRVWLTNPTRALDVSTWTSTSYATDWVWDDVFIDTADFNNDGFKDVVLSPAEEAGKYYHIAWFEAPSHPGESWVKHVIDDHVEAVHHFIAARDVNGDGEVEVLTAEMNQGEDPDEIKLYVRVGEKGAQSWTKQVLGTGGAHSMRAADFDGDFDIDLFGANWHFEEPDARYPIKVWRNLSAERQLWPRHLVDADRPGQATFVFAGDMNGDGRKDIVTGAYWYAQPNSLASPWQRKALGKHAYNVALLHDFDGDKDLDFLASGWLGGNHVPSLLARVLHRLGIKEIAYEQPGNRFCWGQNNGFGEFALHKNIASASGDFLQGVGVIQHQNTQRVLLSWHDEKQGLQVLDVPADPVNDIWKWAQLHPVSQAEQVSVVDVDADGLDDIVTGTKWLRNTGRGWEIHPIAATAAEPDRNHVVDMNGDGRLDVVVGFQAVSKKGKLVWFEQPEDPRQLWKEHVISAEVIGPMSLGVGDIDLDKDLDVVVGEHNLAHPELARLMWFENRQANGSAWKGHLIYRGDEHHDGALLVDLDRDDDLDVVSIGWSHGKVVVYENPLGRRHVP
jgi:hypothetical protein